MDKKKKDKKGTEHTCSNSKEKKNERARKASTKRDSTPCQTEEDDLNGNDGQRVTVLDSQSEDEDDLEDDFTSNGSMMTQYDADENDTEDDVTPHEEQVEQETPPIMDDEDSEDDMNEDSIDLERLMDDLTINDTGEKEKNPDDVETEQTVQEHDSEDIEKLWQKWSTDSNSDIFSIADLIQDMYCTEPNRDPTATQAPTATTTSHPSSTPKGRKKKLVKRRKKKIHTRATPVLNQKQGHPGARLYFIRG